MTANYATLPEDSADIVRRRIATGRNRDAQDVLGEALYLRDALFRLGPYGDPRGLMGEVRHRMTLVEVEVWSDPAVEPIYEAVLAEHLRKIETDHVTEPPLTEHEVASDDEQ